MPDPRRLTRADLPEELTPESLRALPLAVLRRLARPGNGVLTADEQPVFDAALREVMRGTAQRVSGQITRPDWASVLDEARRGGPRGGRDGRAGRTGRPSRADQHLQRLARQIGEQAELAEALAPGVDWSFVQPTQPTQPAADEVTQAPAATDDEAPQPADTEGSETVSDLEQRLSDQVELVQVMSEIAEVGKRTYALEQQRDLQETRTVFFGFVVSVAVLVAGWAPLVAAADWTERWWIIGLTLGTCVLAGAVYAGVRRLQTREPASGD